MKYSVSVVVPVYNERDSLPKLHDKLKETLKSFGDWEVVYIDDGSTDGSTQVLSEIASKNENASLVSFARNKGKSKALSAGFSKASGDVFVTLDADLQDDPAEIPKFLSKIEDGFDFVVGWRSERKDGLAKKIPSLLFNKMASVLSEMSLHDINCGLKAMRREVALGLRLHGELHRYMPVLADWLGYRVCEVSVKHSPRLYGKSKYGIMRLPKGFLDLITVKFLMGYSSSPLHFFGSLGILLCLVGVLVEARVLYLKLVLNEMFKTHITLILLGVFLAIVGVQFISMGLLGELIISERK